MLQKYAFEKKTIFVKDAFEAHNKSMVFRFYVMTNL